MCFVLHIGPNGSIAIPSRCTQPYTQEFLTARQDGRPGEGGQRRDPQRQQSLIHGFAPPSQRAGSTSPSTATSPRGRRWAWTVPRISPGLAFVCSATPRRDVLRDHTATTAAATTAHETTHRPRPNMPQRRFIPPPPSYQRHIRRQREFDATYLSALLFPFQCGKLRNFFSRLNRFASGPGMAHWPSVLAGGIGERWAA